ncbi:MAG: hypothetical protein WAR01_15685, partial [Dokdonella sp.]
MSDMVMALLPSPLAYSESMKERGWGRGGGAQRLPDHFQYRVAAQKDIVIPEPQYVESLRAQPGITLKIVYRLQMLSAIRFNDQASAEVHE